MAFGPDGRTLATTSGDRTIKLFDLKTLKELRVFTGHDEQISGIAFSPDGKRLASASSDQTVRLWDTQTGESVLTLAFTTIYQWGWVLKFLNAASLPLAAGIFLVFPILSFFMATLTKVPMPVMAQASPIHVNARRVLPLFSKI